jgi:hypothetical protein
MYDRHVRGLCLLWYIRALLIELPEIWDALKACCEAEDMETAKLLIEAAGVIVASSDMTICYDERGVACTVFPYNRPSTML